MDQNNQIETLFDLIKTLDHNIHSELSEFHYKLESLKDLLDQLEQKLRNLRNEG